MSVYLLAIDASTDLIELALTTPDQLRSTTLAGGAAASASLLPAVRELCAAAACRLGDLDAVAFGAGPGAFTGLRTACATAQGLAFGLDRPVLALDTLAAVAEAAWADRGAQRLWAALDARMGEVYAVPMRRLGAGAWQAERPVALYSPQALLANLGADDLLAGPAVAAYAVLADAPAALRCAQARPAGAALAAVALAAWQADAAQPAHLALPVYVRDKVAQTTVERAAERAAQFSTAGQAA
jgi:tRNA threonylcarbamoyladenosine biosynthesis protein TsaB